jgi:uncharacterized protein with HEPN domain
VPSSDPLQRFQDILNNIDCIERFTAGLSAQAFGENEQAVFAVQHALLIISEAGAKLGDLASPSARQFLGATFGAWEIDCDTSIQRST